MLISSVNISQGWMLSGCASVPHRGDGEIAWEAQARVEWREGRLDRGGKKRGPRKSIISVPDSHGSSLAGDRQSCSGARGGQAGPAMAGPKDSGYPPPTMYNRGLGRQWFKGDV